MRYSIKNTFLPVLFAAMMIAAAGSFAQAQGTGDAPQIIAYPIAELGSCGSKETCKKYCDEAANQAACLAYAESHGLMSKASVAAAKIIIAKKGPGGCSSKESCTTYCQSSEHTDECVSFAQRFGALATTTASLIKKIKIDGGPGGCKSSEECKTYCKAPAHLSECKEFAQTAGITKKPADTRITALLAEKPGPGGCTTQEECKTYCSSGEHGTECRQFAVDNKMITQDQFDKSQKAATLTGPGGCQGQECKTYCQDSEHKTECYDFAVENGLISKENADTAQSLDATLKTSSGPGGCTSADSCRAYCSDASHSSECQAFISRHKPPQSAGQGGSASSTTGAPRMLPPQPGTMPQGGQNAEEKAKYCKEHPASCGAGSGSSTPNNQAKPPLPTMPPKPTTTNPTGTSGTANLPCKNIDECRALCAKSAAECAKLPPDMQKYIMSTKPSTVLPPTNTTTTPPPTGTTQPPATDTSGSTNTDTGAGSATVAGCNTLEECKILCTKTPAACASFPPETLKYILNSGTVQPPATKQTQPPANTSTGGSALGAAIFIGLVRLLGF